MPPFAQLSKIPPHWDDRAEHTQQLVTAGLTAVDSRRVAQRHLVCEGDTLRVGVKVYHLPDFRRVLVVGFGKASAAMAQAAEAVLGAWLSGGLVLTKYGHSLPLERVEVIEAGHPTPDETGVRGVQQLLGCVGHTTSGDLVLALVSGGGSALLTLPVEGVSLAELQVLNADLLRSGATVHQINTVRKHLSRVKGGGLARKLYPAQVATLVLSDVVGNQPDVIASGPLSADPTTFADARDVLMSIGLWEQLPPGIAMHLHRGLVGEVPATPKPGDPIFEQMHTVIVGDNALAAQAVTEEARALGFYAQLLTTFLEGEAREVAKVVVALAREVAASGYLAARPTCLVLGGETTVTVRGEGRGGRNQEVALAAAIGFAEVGLERVRLLCLATDGGDGPTDAAGAIAEEGTVARARRVGLDAHEHLARNDSYAFFDPLGDLIRTGPTGTNVNDLLVLLMY